MLKRLLFTLYERKDDKRTFTVEQRRIIWNGDKRRRCPGKQCGHRLLTWDNFTVDERHRSREGPTHEHEERAGHVPELQQPKGWKVTGIVGQLDAPPDGWRWCRLNDVCLERTGIRDPRNEPEKPFRYVDISGVDNLRKCIAEARTILGKDAPSRARQMIRTGDVIVATTRPNLNAVAMIPPELDGQICSTGFCVLRVEPTVLLPGFLFAFVRHEMFVQSLTDLVRGALYPAVNDPASKSTTNSLAPAA